MNPDFPRNLRVLTDHYKSVAEVCRRLDLNRSQFNRYISGRSMPSRHVFKKICDFFGVEEYEIFLPHQEFLKIVGLKRNQPAADDGFRPYVAYLDQLVRRSRGDLLDYEGYYFEYSYSMTRPGLILRSLLRLSGNTGFTTYQRVENMARFGTAAPRVTCKYRGMAFYLNDRIFLVDYDSLTGNEISQTVLYPNYQTRLTRLNGLKLGVAASGRREPLCARVLLEALGRQISVKKALRSCGLFDPESAEIQPDIRSLITNKIEGGAHHFRVVSEG